MTRTAVAGGIVHAVLLALLVLSGLGSQPLWEDEAVVALFAGNLAFHGDYSGWDGVNLTAPRNATGVDDQLRPLEPPLQHYLAAASLRLCGRSAWAVRLPFALCGLAGLLLFWCWLRGELPQSPGVRQYAFIAAAYSVPMILFLRQGRYPALTLLLGMAVLLAWRVFAAGRRGGGMLLAATLVLLFYAHYLIAFAWLAALAGQALTLQPRRELLRRGVPVVLVWLAATVPYTLMFRLWTNTATPTQYQNGWHYPLAVLRALRDVSSSGFLPWLGAVVAVAAIVRLPRTPVLARARAWLLFAGAFVLVMTLLSPQPADDGLPLPTDNWLARHCPRGLERLLFTATDFRYWLPAAPLLAGALGLVCWQLAQYRRWLGVLLMALLLLTTAGMWDPLGLLGGGPVRWLLPGFIGELRQPLPNGTADAARVLAMQTRPGQTIAVTPSFMTYPLMAALGDRLQFTMLLDRRRAAQLAVRLPERLIVGGPPADWQVLVMLPHQPLAPPAGYRLTVLGEYPAYLAQRPELNVHAFTPAQVRCGEVWWLAQRLQ